MNQEKFSINIEKLQLEIKTQEELAEKNKIILTLVQEVQKLRDRNVFLENQLKEQSKLNTEEDDGSE